MKTGIVIKSTGSWFDVRDESGHITNCRIKGKFRTSNIRSTNPVAVGDNVSFDFEDNNTGVITEISERKNYIIRKASNLSKESQVIAANIDQVFLLVTLKMPETTTMFIDRFLITAEAYSIPTILIFNKIDIYNDTLKERLSELKTIYSAIGYKCIEISVIENINIETLKEELNNKTTLISGNSGVGKSSLINKFDPIINQKTGIISSSHNKGKHTTTFAEMFELSYGGYIIDTPGIKGFGLIDFGKYDLFHYFPEIFKESAKCQYNNCIHVNEPSCAVKNAVEKGIISEERYYNYLTILHQDDEKYRK
ncbi:MAG: ribosome small subunit-dependent GTPase A [Bacteroidetes bacterium GWA2_30_7]|nr:MAG: ribosome small subunit-dependent GTPase A [Bacteroidetes bacterium GWA2_30_7]